MRRLLHNDLEYSQANAVYTDHFCPECKKHRMVHDDSACTMRYEGDLLCATFASKPQPQQPLHYLDGDSGCIV